MRATYEDYLSHEDLFDQGLNFFFRSVSAFQSVHI